MRSSLLAIGLTTAISAVTFQAAVAVAPAAASAKCGSQRCDTKFAVPAGKTVKWRSPRMAGEADQLRLAVNGRKVHYELVAKTGGCRAYGYGLGVVVSMADCGNGRRYIRVRVTNTSDHRRTVRFGYRVLTPKARDGDVVAGIEAGSGDDGDNTIPTTTEGDHLPFTGSDLAVLAVAGGALLGMGFALRLMTRARYF